MTPVSVQEPGSETGLLRWGGRETPWFAARAVTARDDVTA
jgi:hypothetical protein